MLAFYTNGHISGEIRARQIGEYLNARVDPVDVDPNDINIYIKNASNINKKAKYTYIDVVDNIDLRYLLKDLNVGIIAFTKRSQNHLYKILRKDVIYIPQHHCNFENYIRDDREIKTVGFIGGSLAFRYSFEKMNQLLKTNNFDFKVLILNNSKGLTRQDVIDFYKDVDIQIYYRSGSGYPSYLYKDSLKFMNAASFKIPTVAKVGNTLTEEMRIANMPIVESIEDMILWCNRLRKDKFLYSDISNSAYEISKSFHISKIAPLYLKLG